MEEKQNEQDNNNNAYLDYEYEAGSMCSSKKVEEITNNGNNEISRQQKILDLKKKTED